jgi:hypothetical protein
VENKKCFDTVDARYKHEDYLYNCTVCFAIHHVL